MSQYDEILDQVPLQQLASQLGVDESEVEQAARTALPALLGGLQANAHDPAGAQSLASPSPLTREASARPRRRRRARRPEDRRQHLRRQHRPGDEPARRGRLGDRGSGAGGSLVQKLLPILAPIVLSWLANKIGQGGGLGSILGGGSDSASDATAPSADGGPLFPGGQGADSPPCRHPAGRRRRAGPTRSRTSSARCSAAAPVGPEDLVAQAAPETSSVASSAACWAAASASPLATSWVRNAHSTSESSGHFAPGQRYWSLRRMSSRALPAPVGRVESAHSTW